MVQMALCSFNPGYLILTVIFYLFSSLYICLIMVLQIICFVTVIVFVFPFVPDILEILAGGFCLESLVVVKEDAENLVACFC